MNDSLLKAIHETVKENGKELRKHGEALAGTTVKIQNIEKRLDSGKASNIAAQETIRSDMLHHHNSLKARMEKVANIIPTLATDTACRERTEKIDKEVRRHRRIMIVLIGLSLLGGGTVAGTQGGRHILGKIFTMLIGG